MAAQSGFPLSRKNALAWAVGTFILCSLILGVALRSFTLEAVRRAKADFRQELEVHRDGLMHSVEGAVNLLRGVEAFLQAEPLDQRGMGGVLPALAEALVVGESEVQHVILAPNGVVSHMEGPVKPSGAVIGSDLLSDPRHEVRMAARRARDSGATALAGPLAGPRGRLALEIYRPMSVGKRFWGLSGLVLDLQRVIDRSGLAAHSDIRFALRKGDAVFHGEVTAEEDPVSVDVPLREGAWTLDAAPANGWWGLVRGRVLLAGISGEIIVILLACVMYALVRRQELMQATLGLAERQRDDSREQYRAIFDSVSDGILVLTPEGAIQEVNAAAESLLGLTRESLLGRNAQDLAKAKDQPRVAELLVAAGVGRSMDVELARNGGHFSAMARTSAMQHGGMTHVLLLFTDITERIRARRERDQIFNRAMDLLCVGDFHGRLFQCNPAWETTLGRKAEEHVGGLLAEMVHPDDRGAMLAALGRLFAGEALQGFVCRLRHADGTWRYVSWNVFPETDSRVFFGVGRDVTELIRAEERLNRANEELAGMNEELTALNEELVSSNQGLVEEVARRVEAERGLKGANEELAAMYEQQAAMNEQQAAMNEEQAAMNEELTATNAELRSEIERRSQAEAELLAAKEHLFGILENTTDAFFETDGNFVVTFMNRKAERPLHIKREDLLGKNLWQAFPQAVGSLFEQEYVRAMAEGRAVEFEAYYQPFDTWYEVHAYPGKNKLSVYFRDVTSRRKADEALHAALREKEVMLKEIHHRVKNNLQVVSSLLGLQAGSLSDPEVLALFDESKDRILSMALVHEELYQARDLSGVPFRDYIEKLVSRLAATLSGGRGIETDLRLSDVRLPVDSAIPCGLIVNELVTNAFKHGFKGRERGILRVAVDEAGGRVMVEVADDGVGFPEGLDFRQTESLGMQLVVNLAEQLGGSVDLRRVAGASFLLSFPREKDA